MKRRMLSVAILAAALALGAPLAANAVDYPATTSLNVNISPGGTYNYFAAASVNLQPVDTTVTGTLTGEFADQGAIVPASTSRPSTHVVSAAGTIGYKVTVPTTAVIGSKYFFDVAAGTFSQRVVLTIVGAPAVDATDITNPSAGGLLAFTGGDASALFWFGGGLVVLGGAFVAMMTMIRRSRKSSSLA